MLSLELVPRQLSAVRAEGTSRQSPVSMLSLLRQSCTGVAKCSDPEIQPAGVVPSVLTQQVAMLLLHPFFFLLQPNCYGLSLVDGKGSFVCCSEGCLMYRKKLELLGVACDFCYCG